MPLLRTHRSRIRAAQVTAELMRIPTRRLVLPRPVAPRIFKEGRPLALPKLPTGFRNHPADAIEPLAQQYTRLKLNLLGDQLHESLAFALGKLQAPRHRAGLEREVIPQRPDLSRTWSEMISNILRVGGTGFRWAEQGEQRLHGCCSRTCS